MSIQTTDRSRSPSGRGELIAYERPDTLGPKTSNYLITPTANPRARVS